MMYTRAFAGCTPCPPGDWQCGLGKWFCDVRNDPVGALTKPTGIPAVDQGPFNTIGQGVVNSNPTLKAVDNTANQVQGDIWKCLQGGTPLGCLPPWVYLAAGGVGLILLLILIKR